MESGHTQRNFRDVTPICSFEKVFKTAWPWTSEETESVLLNLGKCWKTKGMNEPRMQKRGDKQKPSQREFEGTHFKMCVINVRSSVSIVFTVIIGHDRPILIGSVNPNQLMIQRQEEREKLKLRQLNAKQTIMKANLHQKPKK